MGTEAHVVVVGPNARDLARLGGERLAALESKWSRFIPTSEVSRCNAMSQSHVLVSWETLLLFERAIEGWERTNGLFDPTVLVALCNAGYDRNFGAVPARARRLVPAAGVPAPGCAGIVCDARMGTVTLPRDVHFDPGGIGKGLAADLVSAELIERGALGALVNVGGDLRARGEAPNCHSWDVAIEDPARPGVELLRIGLVDGAVATSSRISRRWQTRAGEAHHLIDPHTGEPSKSRHATVAAIAYDAWWAEVVTKTVLVGGLGVDEARQLGARIVTVANGGDVAFDRDLVAVS